MHALGDRIFISPLHEQDKKKKKNCYLCAAGTYAPLCGPSTFDVIRAIQKTRGHKIIDQCLKSQ
jgi:hypothetical protein